MSQHNELSRRQFIKSAAVAGAAVATAGVLSAAPAQAQAQCGVPAKWDLEADVVVVGFGGAGASAAMMAKEAGANVLVIEKMTEPLDGGSTGISGGNFSWALDKASITGTLGTVDDKYLQAVTDELKQVAVFYDSLKLNTVKLSETNIMAVGGGWVLWKAMKEEVAKRGIKVMYETPGKRLVQNPQTKEILGIVAASGGKEISIKAKQAVIMTTGSYGQNQDMLNTYNLAGQYIAHAGGNGNTGDGQRMCQAVGAKEWHYVMGAEWYQWAFKLASQQYKTGIGLPSSTTANGFIFVNRQGQRFMDEKTLMAHDKSQHNAFDFGGNYLTPVEKKIYPHNPFFMVFDETNNKLGHIDEGAGAVTSGSGQSRTSNWNNVHKVYQWSADNSEEIKKGWIFKADTLEELAAKITGTDGWGATFHVDPAGLAATVKRYNEFCQAGKDDDFARAKTGLVPLSKPPYYAIEMCPNVIYTLGGPKNNYLGQTLDVEEKPIPRLYHAGDLGSFGLVLPGGVVGALAMGRIAARNAAKLQAWG